MMKQLLLRTDENYSMHLKSFDNAYVVRSLQHLWTSSSCLMKPIL
jgi:hypothetical protein